MDVLCEDERAHRMREVHETRLDVMYRTFDMKYVLQWRGRWEIVQLIYVRRGFFTVLDS